MTHAVHPAPRDLAATEQRGHVPGEEGLWVFILGDLTIFTLFFGTLIVSRAKQPEVFLAAQRDLHPPLAIANTALLLLGSYLMVRGVAAVRAGRPSAARLFVGTAACGLGFAAVKALEYTLLALAGHSPGQNDFFMYYFVFTGIHLAHLVIGVVLASVLARQARRQTPSARFAEIAGCYWHLVDGLWLVLFPLLYLAR